MTVEERDALKGLVADIRTAVQTGDLSAAQPTVDALSSKVTELEAKLGTDAGPHGPMDREIVASATEGVPTMTAWDPADFDNNLIADMRAHGGQVTTGPMAGQPLLVMTSTGAKTGEPRRAIVNFHRDGEDYVIAGTASGSSTHPAWLSNIRADLNVTVEAEGRTFQAKASVAETSERDRLWDQHVAAFPRFAAYPEQAGRVIPMVRLTPVA